jgi:hypothetical protein
MNRVRDWITYMPGKTMLLIQVAGYQALSLSDVPAAPALFGCISNRFCHGFGDLLVKDVGEDTLASRPG